MSLKTIKNKIRSINKTRQVTKAMESVSAVKMRKSQEQALLARPYAYHAINILKRISGSLDNASHFLMSAREVKNTCIIIISSDKGLAGNLNNALLKKTVRTIKEKNLNRDNVGFICVGRKGFEFFSKRGYKIEKYLERLGDNVSSDSLKEILELSLSLYEEERYDSFIVVYTNFISTFNQEALARVVLPISFDEVEKMVKGITPEKGKYSNLDVKRPSEEEKVNEYIFEPNAKDILKELLPFLLNIQIYHTLLEAKASEHSARMVAMKSASDKAGEMFKSLNLEFNKARQASITRELGEITAGIEAMAER